MSLHRGSDRVGLSRDVLASSLRKSAPQKIMSLFGMISGWLCRLDCDGVVHGGGSVLHTTGPSRLLLNQPPFHDSSDFFRGEANTSGSGSGAVNYYLKISYTK
jgi:hypothetical protein